MIKKWIFIFLLALLLFFLINIFLYLFPSLKFEDVRPSGPLAPTSLPHIWQNYTKWIHSLLYQCALRILKLFKLCFRLVVVMVSMEAIFIMLFVSMGHDPQGFHSRIPFSQEALLQIQCCVTRCYICHEYKIQIYSYLGSLPSLSPF